MGRQAGRLARLPLATCNSRPGPLCQDTTPHSRRLVTRSGTPFRFPVMALKHPFGLSPHGNVGWQLPCCPGDGRQSNGRRMCGFESGACGSTKCALLDCPPPPRLHPQGEPGLWIYECLAACATDEERTKKMETRPEYEAAVRQFFQDDAEAAEAAFDRVLAAHPEDAAAKAFLDRLHRDDGDDAWLTPLTPHRTSVVSTVLSTAPSDVGPEFRRRTQNAVNIISAFKAFGGGNLQDASLLQDVDPPTDVAPPTHGTDNGFRKRGSKVDADPQPPHVPLPKPEPVQDEPQRATISPVPSLSLESLPVASPKSQKSARSARYKETSFRLPRDKVRPRADDPTHDLEVVSQDPSLTPRPLVVLPGQDDPEPEAGQGGSFQAKKRTALWKVKAKLWLKLGLAMAPPFVGLTVMTCLVFSDLIQVRCCVFSGATFSGLRER